MKNYVYFINHACHFYSFSLQVLYFEVGNLNTETYPASANLPPYVRENYWSGGKCTNCNIDRIIIGYRVKTRVVETVYVTEHEAAMSGRFRSDRTYEISSELIQALQNPQLDLTTFLIQMGYYVNVLQGVEAMPYSDPAAQQTFSVVQNYSGATATAQLLHSYPCSYEQTRSYVAPQTRAVAHCSQASWERFNEGKVRLGFSLCKQVKHFLHSVSDGCCKVHISVL